MIEIRSQKLWIGNAIEIRDMQLIANSKVAAIVDLALEEKPAQPPRHLSYLRFPLSDSNANDILTLALSVNTICQLVENEVPTVVACSAGLSRAPTVTAFALAKHLGDDPSTVVQRVAKMKQLDINPLFWAQTEHAFLSMDR